MFVYRTSPFDEIFNVFRELDNLFGRSFSSACSSAPLFSASGFLPGLRWSAIPTRLAPGPSGETTALAPTAEAPVAQAFIPPVETLVRDGRCIVRAELPGVEAENVQVQVVDGYLTISGERRSEHKEEDARWLRRESVYGSFSRSFRLPEDVSTDDLKASFRNGVLEVGFPLPERAVSRSVKIEVDGQAGQKKIAAA